MALIATGHTFGRSETKNLLITFYEGVGAEIFSRMALVRSNESPYLLRYAGKDGGDNGSGSMSQWPFSADERKWTSGFENSTTCLREVYWQRNSLTFTSFGLI